METQNKVDKAIEDTVVFIEENICSHLETEQKAGLLQRLYLIAMAQMVKDLQDQLEKLKSND